jgi:hypothetical protein
MGFRSLIENPDGGQVLSALIALTFIAGLSGYVAFGVAVRLVRGVGIEINRDGVGLLLLSVISIPALIKFIRSRHAR